MDWVRSCYATRARLYPDSDDAVTMTWFFAAKNAKLFPHYHRFGSGNWASGNEPWEGPGEVQGASRRYFKGARPSAKLGREFHGPLAGFQGGLAQADAVGLPLGLDGSPVCGKPDVLPLATGGRSTMFLRPGPWWIPRGPCAYPAFPSRILWRIDNGFTVSKIVLTWDGHEYWRGAGTYQRQTSPFGDWVTLPCELRLHGNCANLLEMKTQAEDYGFQQLYGGPSLFPPFPWNAGTRVFGTYPYAALTAYDGYATGDDNVSLGDYEMIGRLPPINSAGDPATGGSSTVRGRFTRRSVGGLAAGGSSTATRQTRTVGSVGGLAAGGGSEVIDHLTIRSAGGLATGGGSEVTGFTRMVAGSGGLATGGSSTATAGSRRMRSSGGLATSGSSKVGRSKLTKSAGGLADGGSSTATGPS